MSQELESPLDQLIEERCMVNLV